MQLGSRSGILSPDLDRPHRVAFSPRGLTALGCCFHGLPCGPGAAFPPRTAAPPSKGLLTSSVLIPTSLEKEL